MAKPASCVPSFLLLRFSSKYEPYVAETNDRVSVIAVFRKPIDVMPPNRSMAKSGSTAPNNPYILSHRNMLYIHMAKM